METPLSGLIPLGDPQPEANLVLARYDQPSIPHVGLSSLNQETVSQTINYTYDPLGRLTAADYSTGDYYHYTYDAVGNRLYEVNVTNGSVPNDNDYTYNAANSLVDISGTSYTWDANGNLLSDDVNDYTYDPANRLRSVEQGNNSYTFSYDGLGDRLQQTVNSETTNYTLDLNTGLTQVLDDSTDTYLYGVDRIAQVGGENTDYFLGDALGSVRQLADENGEITLGESYDPYGNVIASIGDSTSVYGFDGEAVDQSGLTYLRARYYSAQDGRFQTRDTWDGDVNQPLSLNKWVYTNGNPVNYTDPSGKYPVHCQSMPTKAAYEACVVKYYGLEPFDRKQMGATVEGSTGCYSGPTSYRAPGYIEGIGGATLLTLGAGIEVVYDFATMQRTDFKYTGQGIHNTLVGGSVIGYTGYVYGLKISHTDPQLQLYNIVKDYSGIFYITSLGFSLGKVLTTGAGFTTFQSEKDPMIQGKTYYMGGSLGYDIGPGGVDVVRLRADYSLYTGYVENYILSSGLVNSGKLLSDISTGNGSVPYLYTGVLAVPLYAARNEAVTRASKYIKAYTELRFQKILGW